MIVTFFGHRDTPPHIEIALRNLLIDLIENKDARCFYVGTHGNFDSMAKKVLKELCTRYPHIQYAVVLAYRPPLYTLNQEEYEDILFPESIAQTPRRFAISKRNEWMIQKADIIVTYVAHSMGGAAFYKTMAQKKGKTIIELFVRDK